MFAVVFAVFSAPDAYQRYLDIAAALRPHLDDIEGFLSIERFTGLHGASRAAASCRHRSIDIDGATAGDSSLPIQFAVHACLNRHRPGCVTDVANHV